MQAIGSMQCIFQKDSPGIISQPSFACGFRIINARLLFVLNNHETSGLSQIISKHACIDYTIYLHVMADSCSSPLRVHCCTCMGSLVGHTSILAMQNMVC